MVDTNKNNEFLNAPTANTGQHSYVRAAKQTLLSFFRRLVGKNDVSDEQSQFNEFSPQEYNALYYPPINITDSQAILGVINKNTRRVPVGKSLTDLKSILLNFFKKPIVSLRQNSSIGGQYKNTVNLTELSHDMKEMFVDSEATTEAVENFCIYAFMLKAIEKILQIRPDDHLKVLDVGGGPTIYQHIPIVAVASSICHAEFSESNRYEVKKWLSGDLKGQWDGYFKLFSELLRSHPESYATADLSVKEKIASMIETTANYETITKEVIKKVIAVDVFKKDLGDEVVGEFDLATVSRHGSAQLLTSNFCLESITADRKKFKSGLQNITNYIAPGGFLLMTAVRNSEWYSVGKHKMPATKLNTEVLLEELKVLGFEILETTELVEGPNKEEVGYDGMIMVLARKNSKSY